MSATALWEKDDFEAMMNATILYEERAAAKRAKALLEGASARTDAGTPWSVKPWRLDMLDWPPLAQAVLRETTNAHLVMLAVCGKEEFHPGFLSWLETWATHRQVRDAALAVVGGDGFSTAAIATLDKFAERHGLRLILDKAGPAKDSLPRVCPDFHKRQGDRPPPTARLLEQLPPYHHSNWGLCE